MIELINANCGFFGNVRGWMTTSTLTSSLHLIASIAMRLITIESDSIDDRLAMDADKNRRRT